MEVVKYWKVELFRDSDRRSGITGMTSPTSPFFTGYSREKPALNLQSDVQPGEYIELYTAPDALESRLFRRHSFDYIHLTPIFESGEKCCDDDEHAKSDADKYLLSKGFKDAARPLIQWLAENAHPHHTAIVDQSGVELLESHERVAIKEYLRD
ncbi:hypothetical protein [Enterobacter asburiae]|uniref:hypothetical protein n=1 Tax=Enterobacter asburiae TaxID=61645 RepID=UPI0021D1254B|nr:hypothetical protein [Enterobacter asburiae]MCU6240777.1 hypothetical protein [Enterobacter asburiae]